MAEGFSNPFRLPRGEPLRRAVVAVFERQRAAILKYLTTGRKDQPADPPLPFHWPGWHDFGLGALDVAERFTPLLTATWDAAAAKFAPRVGLDPNSWSVVNPHTERAIDDAALAFSDSMNQTTSKSLDVALDETRKALHEGIIDKGEALPALTKRIHAIFDGATRWRARRIAWTETSRAVHAAQEAAAVASGVVTGWKWLLSSDACPLCVAIAARAPAVRLGHAFAVIGDNPHYSQVKFPPAHPHCNCAVEEVLDTDEQPTFHDTLHQPEPATAAEIDAVAAQIAERDQAIAAGKPPKWTPPPPRKPKPKPRPAPEMFELPVRNPMGPTPGEPIGSHLPSDEDIEAGVYVEKPRKPKPPKAPKKPSAVPPFPKVGDDFQEVRTLGGSTGAKLVRHVKTGRLYVHKKGGNPDHLREEATADDLYRAMGLDVPRSKLYERPAGPVKLSEFREGKTLGDLKTSDPAAYAAAVLEIRKGFVADALLGNWDVIGMSADNILVTAEGKVLRIDNGGSLRFRAQGGKKSGSQWTGTVGELASLRNHAINPAAAAVFAGIGDDEIKGQIKAVLRKRAAILKAAPADVRDVLAQRLDYLKAYANPPKTPKRIGNWKPTPESEFYRPTSGSDGAAWGARHYDDWAKGLTHDEKKAIQYYTGSGYVPLNRWLRNSGSPASDAKLAEISRHLDSALSKKPAPEGIIAYRQMPLSAMGIDRASLKPGQDIADLGYTSTTLKPGGVWHGDKFEVRIPKGTPGAWVNSAGAYSSHPSEMEFTIGREADTFRVIEVRSDVVVVEVITAGAKKGKR